MSDEPKTKEQLEEAIKMTEQNLVSADYIDDFDRRQAEVARIRNQLARLNHELTQLMSVPSDKLGRRK